MSLSRRLLWLCRVGCRLRRRGGCGHGALRRIGAARFDLPGFCRLLRFGSSGFLRCRISSVSGSFAIATSGTTAATTPTAAITRTRAGFLRSGILWSSGRLWPFAGIGVRRRDCLALGFGCFRARCSGLFFAFGAGLSAVVTGSVAFTATTTVGVAAAAGTSLFTSPRLIAARRTPTHRCIAASGFFGRFFRFDLG